MQIPLRIETININRPNDHLLAGVPVKRGELSETGWMTLQHSTGQAWPVHTSPAAYWPDGSVKWLHIAGSVSLDAAEVHELVLDTKLAAADGLPQLSVTTDRKAVRVTGGPVDVAFGPDIDGWLNAAPQTGSSGAAVQGLTPKLEFVGPTPTDHPRAGRFVIDDAAPQVITNTANRVVLRSAGKWLDANDQPMAELRLFVEVLGDTAEVRLQPVFVYLGDPQQDLVRHIELKVQTSMGAELPSMDHIATLTGSTIHMDNSAPRDPQPIDDITYGFGEEQGRGYWDKVRPYVHLARFPIARQVQIGSSFYRTEKRVLPEGCSWVKASEGQKAQGWCHLSQDGAGITAALRYYWEEYPASLGVDAEHGTLSLGFWPEASQPLDFRRYSPLIYQSDAYESSKGFFPAQSHGAYGVAKAREFVLQFHDQPVETHEQRLAVALRALRFTQPLRAMTTGQYFADSESVGLLAAIDTQRDDPQVKRVCDYIDLIATERDSRGWYGMIDFGDVIMSYYTDLDRWSFDDGGYGWTNTEHAPDYGLWVSALASGRHDWFNLAIEMARHNRDVDTYHAGNFIGSGTRHNVNHWGCANKEWRVTNPISKRLHYYTTADPWTAEVIDESIATHRSYERTATLAPSIAAALGGALVRWEMTGSEDEGRILRKMTDVYASAFNEEGNWYRRVHFDLATGEGYPEKPELAVSHFFFETFGGLHTLCELAHLLDHDELTDSIARYAHYRFNPGEDGREPGLGPSIAQAFTWLKKNDHECRDRVRDALAKPRHELHTTGGHAIDEEPLHTTPVEMLRRNKFVCHLASFLQQAPFALRALDSSEDD